MKLKITKSLQFGISLFKFNGRQLKVENSNLQAKIDSIERLNDNRDIERKIEEMAQKFKELANDKLILKKENVIFTEFISDFAERFSHFINK